MPLHFRSELGRKSSSVIIGLPFLFPFIFLDFSSKFCQVCHKMNCPSRNDDLDWTPGWNQNPPFLSADLTTRQDLNGIVNMRELRRGSCYPSDKSLDNDFQSSLDRSSRGSSPLSLNGWFWWLLSVFCTSLFLSNIKMFASLNFRSILGNFGRSAMGEPISVYLIWRRLSNSVSR